MASKGELTSKSREPAWHTKWRDAEGDVWSYDLAKQGWQYDNSARFQGNPVSFVGAWSRVKREYELCFPMTEIVEDPPPAVDLVELADRTAEAHGFMVKDSGQREELGNGFVRDTEDGKPDLARYLKIPGLELLPVEFLERWAAHMVKGAEKYGPDNWRQARGQHSLERFERSATRHLRQLIRGDRDEDHAAAVAFNVAAMEYVRGLLDDGAENRADSSGASA